MPGCPGIARVGAEIVNVGGTEAVTTQEYCEMAGEILGKKPTFVENSKAWPIWADTTKMVELLGPNKVPVREGVRRTIEAAKERLDTAHHVVGEPRKVSGGRLITFIAHLHVPPENTQASS
jgi:hypothetical protein